MIFFFLDQYDFLFTVGYTTIEDVRLSIKAFLFPTTKDSSDQGPSSFRKDIKAADTYHKLSSYHLCSMSKSHEHL